MKILQIIQEQETVRVTNSSELAAAFDANEWIRIAEFFAQQRGRNLGDDRSEIDGQMATINRTVGSNMSSTLTTTEWNVMARRYGMAIDQSDPSWQDIYDHLARAAEEGDMPQGWNTPGSFSGAGFGATNTPELLIEIQGLVPVDVDEWTDSNALTREYLVPMLQAIIDIRPQWRDPELLPQGVQSWFSNNNSLALYYTRLTREILPAKIQEEGRVTKEYVDIVIWNWLKQADLAFSNYRRNR